MSEALVELRGAGVKEGPRWRVRGVNFSVARGEIVTLIGPNGSGKSTTAKLALGILAPSEGEVRRGAVKVGYVPQKLSLDWTLPLSVERFVRLTGKLTPAEVGQALARTGVQALRSRALSELSGGEFQRVMLARALARQPDLLVLDEPVQGVDFNGEIELYRLISELRQEMNCGVLLISHDLHVVMAETDRVICLNGHVCCQGSPQTVSEDPQYRRLFGAHMAPALSLYTHHHDHAHMPDGTVVHADGRVTADCGPHHHGATKPGPEHVHGD